MLKIAVIIIMIISSACATRFGVADEIRSLQELVDGYHFIHPWTKNVFECSDMACANQAFLQGHGYKSKIAIVTYESDPNHLHCVTLAALSDGWICLDTRVKYLDGRSLNSSLGKVISPYDILEIVDSPAELVKFDRGIAEKLRAPYLTNVIEPNSEPSSCVSDFGH